MIRVWHVFVREYLENVRTKAFLVGLVLTPLWFVLVFLVPKLAESAERPPRRVVLVDATEVLAEEVEQALLAPRPPNRPRYEVERLADADPWAPGEDGTSAVDRLSRRAAEGDAFAVILTPPLLEKRRAGPGERASEILGASNLGDVEVGKDLENVVHAVVNRRFLRENRVPEDLAARLGASAIDYRSLTKEGQAAGAAQMLAPMAFMLLLFMGIVGISQMLVSNTLEEKSSRVFEVILSSVSPLQLMTGKLLGICAVGFTLMTLWAGGGLLAAAIQGITGLVDTAQVGLLIAYYVLGFFLIASLMAAVGSACNTLKEAQNLMAPISLLLAFPMLLALVVLRDPNGTFATAASFVPPFTPFLMMARIGSTPGPPAWQIPASLLLLAVSTWLSLRLSARVFRVGILLYGKPPSLKEIWRWVRAR